MAEFNLLNDSGAEVVTGQRQLGAAPATAWRHGVWPFTRAMTATGRRVWHSQSKAPSLPLPHWVRGQPRHHGRTISGFKYLPRPGGHNGTIAAWRFHTSPDGVNWTLVAQGSFDDFPDRAAEKTIFLNGTPPPNQPPTLAAVPDTTSKRSVKASRLR